MLYLYIPASDHTTECGYYQKPQPWRAPCCIFTFQHLITRRSVDIIRNHNPDEPHVVFLHSSIWLRGGVWTLSETTTLTSAILYLYIPASDHTAECGHYEKPQPWRAPCCIYTFQHLITRRGVDIIRNHSPDEPHVVSLHSSIWSHDGVWKLSKTQPWRASCCILTFKHLITRRSVDIIRNHNPDEPHVVYLHSSIWSHGGVWASSETTALTSPMLYLYIPASDHTTECGHYQKPQPWRALCFIFTFQYLITRRSVDIIRNHNPDEPHVLHLHSNIWSHDGVWILSETTTLTSPMLYIYIPTSDHTVECGYYQKPQPWRAPCCIFTFQHLITRRSVDIIRNHNQDDPLFLFVSHGDPHTPIEVFQIQIQVHEICSKKFRVYFRICLRWRQAYHGGHYWYCYLGAISPSQVTPPSAAYMRLWIGSTLVQIMACRLFGTKPLSKPTLGFCQSDPQEQTSMNF